MEIQASGVWYLFKGCFFKQNYLVWNFFSRQVYSFYQKITTLAQRLQMLDISYFIFYTIYI